MGNNNEINEDSLYPRKMNDLYQVIRMFTVWSDEEQRNMIFEPGIFIEADKEREVIILFGKEFDVTFDEGWEKYLDSQWDCWCDI